MEYQARQASERDFAGRDNGAASLLQEGHTTSGVVGLMEYQAPHASERDFTGRDNGAANPFSGRTLH